MTRLLDPSEIDTAAALLLEGELVAFPTETVYGLGAVVDDDEAIAKIFSAKGRPADNPLIVHIASLEQVKSIACDIPPLFYVLAKAFWPGPLTMILKKDPAFHSRATAGLSSVAVRMPAHPIAHALIQRTAKPLAAPSANLSGRPSPTHSEHVLTDLGGSIAAIIKGGCCEVGVESTVISLLGSTPQLLRPGCLSQRQIESVLGLPLIDGSCGKIPLSPGMKYRHYAPLCPLYLMESVQELSNRICFSKKTMVLSLQSIDLPPFIGRHFALSCRDLYHLLRQADQEGYEEILVLCDSSLHQEVALMNRLKKAAIEPAQLGI